MTEEEAKTKWCPFVRTDTQGPEHAACNRYEGSVESEGLKCIASACMAWRWGDGYVQPVPMRVHPNVLPDHWKGWTVTDATPDARGYIEISPPAPAAPQGFCGLAGSP